MFPDTYIKIFVIPSVHAGSAEIIIVDKFSPCRINVFVVGDVLIKTPVGFTGLLKVTKICCTGLYCIVLLFGGTILTMLISAVDTEGVVVGIVDSGSLLFTRAAGKREKNK